MVPCFIRWQFPRYSRSYFNRSLQKVITMILIFLSVIFFALLVQATFSFGGALIALPLLAFMLDVKVATPLMTILSTVIAVLVLITKWRDIHLQHAWRLIGAACVGIPIGIGFLTNVDVQRVKLVLALTVIVFTLLNMFPIKQLRLRKRWPALIFGFISGVFGGAYNLSGPPIVLYGTLSGWDPATFRATIQSYALWTNLFALAGYAVTGHLTAEVLRYVFYALPVLGLAIYLGNWLHRVIPSQQYLLYVRLLLLGLGLSLLSATFT
jgi:uncharacterized protein